MSEPRQQGQAVLRRDVAISTLEGVQTVVDAHHHLQDLGSGRYPWLAPGRPATFLEGDLSTIRCDYLVDDLIRDLATVNGVKSVHVENGWDASDPVGETAWLQALADRYGVPHGIVAYADLAAPDVHEVLEMHAMHKNVRGIRQILGWSDRPPMHLAPRPGMMDEPGWRNGFGRLHSLGLSFDLQVFPDQFDDALDLCRAYPDTSVVLDHLGLPFDRSADALSLWLASLRHLAEAPNVSVKISGLRLGCPRSSAIKRRDLVLRTIEVFGTERCMFGSNFPVDRLWSDYPTVVAEITAAAATLSATERDHLFRANAERIYRI